ncbi:nuclease-related domain-containing protein [Kitasatospora sp. NBC_00458]|uniref:nuclease-related domain-containing protein n=1 Tax=Kitasatospora sp. NBC_00458 TaxID=2903568 RepID=UPI002E17443B
MVAVSGVGMDEFTVGRWRRHGHDRLYVNQRGADRALGWYDFRTGETVVGDESRRALVERVLAAHLETAAPGGMEPVPGRPAAPPAAPPAPTGFDLAQNAPGDSIRRKIGELEPSRIKRRLAYWLSTEQTQAHTWAVGLRGERVVGRRLDRLRRDGWKVLHSVQFSSGTDIDHLVIGPPGVFTVNTKHHRGAAVWQGDQAITVNRAPTRYAPVSRSESAKVARVLSARSGFPVPVQPVVAVVGAASITIGSTLSPVLLLDGAHVDRHLSGRLPRLRSDQVDQVFAVARDSRTWHS